jgi:tRNA nucleotidyltransferase (CCA-adding enzyme)
VVYLLAIMSRSSQHELAGFCQRFEETAKITAYLLDQKKICGKCRAINWPVRSTTKTAVVVTLLAGGPKIEGLLYIMAIARKNHVKKAISLYVTTLRQIEPAISGNDLIRMGYQPGPQFKKILAFLKNARLDNLVGMTKRGNWPYWRSIFLQRQFEHPWPTLRNPSGYSPMPCYFLTRD